MGNYKHKLTLPLIQQTYVQGIVETTDDGDRIRYFPSIEQVSEKYNVPVATIQTWSTVYGWAGLRQQFQDRQISELLEDADWYRQERIRSDSLTISAVKSLTRVLRQEIETFEEQRSLLEGSSIAQIEKNGRIIGGWARMVKDLKVAAELSLTNKDGSPKTMGEGAGRSADEVKRELDELLKRFGEMR